MFFGDFLEKTQKIEKNSKNFQKKFFAPKRSKIIVMMISEYKTGKNHVFREFFQKNVEKSKKS